MIWVPLLFLFAVAETETADTIMARVAANQDRAESARSAFVYHQNLLVRMNYTNGKLAREEYREYNVTPTSTGIKRERTHFRGKYRDHGKVVEYREPKDFPAHIEIDGEVLTDVADDLAGDKRSKDGIARDLFPLTAKEQNHYIFRLDGTEDYRGTPVYRIYFEPKSEGAWAGEALIDKEEFQPVLITTHQAFKIPLLVKTALGTNVEHCGFKVTYKKFDDGLWFPVTYGGELRLRVLFLYARRIGISMQNSGFRRADVSSKVTFSSIE